MFLKRILIVVMCLGIASGLGCMNKSSQEPLSGQEPSKTFVGHEGVVFTIAFLSGGKALASGGSDKTVRIWDIDTGKLTKLLQHDDDVYSIAFSSKYNRLSVGCYNKTVWIWNTTNWSEIRRLNVKCWAGVVAVRFAKDESEKHLGIAAGGSEDKFYVWDWPNLLHSSAFVGHTDGVHDLCFLPNREEVVTCSYDKTIRFWDLKTKKETGKLDGHSARVRCVTVSPDGKLAASGDGEGTIILWDVVRKTKTTYLQKNAGRINSLAFSPDGRFLASASGDVYGTRGQVIIWEVSSGRALHEIIGHKSQATCAVFSPNGENLATCGQDGKIHLWRNDKLLGGK